MTLVSDEFMRVTRTIILAAVFAAGAAFGRTDAPSFATSTLYKVEITEKKEKGVIRPSLKIDKTVTRTVLRDLDLREGTFWLYESGQAPAKGLRMTLNGKKVSGDFRVTRLDIGEDDYLSDRKVHTFIYSELPRKGDVVEYHITYNYTDIAYCPFFIVENSPNDSMVSFRLDVASPMGWTVTPDIFDILPSAPRLVERNDPSRVIIEFGARPRRPYLDLFAFNGLHALTALEVRKGDVVYTLSSPELMVQWYRDKVNLQPVLAESSSAPFLDSLRLLGDARLQLKGIHDWVRTNIRYLMDDTRGHSILPHNPDSVLSSGFGDCKDRAYLICALAQRLGISVHLGVVSTKPSPPLARLSPWQFNHVICAYDDSLGTVLFDPTAKYSEFEAPPDAIVGKPAVIIDSEQPRFELVTRVDTVPSVDFQLRAHIDSLDAADLSVTVRREYLARLRYLRAEQTIEGWERNMTQVLASYLPNAAISHATLKDSQEDHAIITFKADISRYVAKSSKAWYLPGILLSPFRSADFSDRAGDTLGVYFDELAHARLRCWIVGASLTSEKDPFSLSMPAVGELSSHASADSAGIEYNVAFRLYHTTYESENRARLFSFVAQYNLANKQLISFIRGAL